MASIPGVYLENKSLQGGTVIKTPSPPIDYKVVFLIIAVVCAGISSILAGIASALSRDVVVESSTNALMAIAILYGVLTVITIIALVLLRNSVNINYIVAILIVLLWVGGLILQQLTGRVVDTEIGMASATIPPKPSPISWLTTFSNVLSMGGLVFFTLSVVVDAMEEKSLFRIAEDYLTKENPTKKVIIEGNPREIIKSLLGQTTSKDAATIKKLQEDLKKSQEDLRGCPEAKTDLKKCKVSDDRRAEELRLCEQALKLSSGGSSRKVSRRQAPVNYSIFPPNVSDYTEEEEEESNKGNVSSAEYREKLAEKFAKASRRGFIGDDE